MNLPFLKRESAISNFRTVEEVKTVIDKTYDNHHHDKNFLAGFVSGIACAALVIGEKVDPKEFRKQVGNPITIEKHFETLRTQYKPKSKEYEGATMALPLAIKLVELSAKDKKTAEDALEVCTEFVMGIILTVGIELASSCFSGGKS